MKKAGFREYLFSFIIWTIFPLGGIAQIDVPPLSPFCKISQQVGFGTIAIEYSRPSMRQRIIFGDLVPYNKIWRTGANKLTTIAFSENVTVNGFQVDAGKYKLLTIPGEHLWTIILTQSPDADNPQKYDASNDILRFQATAKTIPYRFETFTIDIGEISTNTACVQLLWENTMVKFKVGTNADDEIMAQIDDELKNPMLKIGNTYWEAANYYFITQRDMKQALEWVNEGIKINGEQYWAMRLKALILAELGDYKGAIKAAKVSINKAKGEKNLDYVQLNEKSIEKWKEMEAM
jgi:hypothetical protein